MGLWSLFSAPFCIYSVVHHELEFHISLSFNLFVLIQLHDSRFEWQEYLTKQKWWHFTKKKKIKKLSITFTAKGCVLLFMFNKKMLYMFRERNRKLEFEYSLQLREAEVTQPCFHGPAPSAFRPSRWWQQQHELLPALFSPQ